MRSRPRDHNGFVVSTWLFATLTAASRLRLCLTPLSSSQRPILCFVTLHFAHLSPFASRRFPCATKWFWQRKSGLDDAFHRSRGTLSQTFSIFFPPHFNNLRRRIPSNPPSVPYSGTGPRKRNLEGKILVFLPFTATGSCLGDWEYCYVSQFRRPSHQAIQSHRRPAQLPNHRQVAKIVRERSPRPSFDPGPQPFSDRSRR